MDKVQSENSNSSEKGGGILRLFKITSILEGWSYILLLFVGVPLKYLAGNAVVVKALGMPHGILFMAYILLALFIRSRMKWDIKTTLIVLIAAVLPFGTFYVNKKFLR